MKYLKDFREHFSEFPVFSVNDARVFLKQRKIGRQYLSLLLHNLLKRNEIIRITKGIYTFRKGMETACFAFSPSYHALQDALSIHGLWEQETNPILVTPRKIRSGARNTAIGTVIVHRIKRSMFFGFSQQKYAGAWTQVSDIEKTLIDFAHFNEPLSREALGEIKKKINKKTLRAYLKRAPERTRKRVEKLLSLKE